MTKDEFNQEYDRITKTAPVEDMMRQQKKLMSMYIDSLEATIARLEQFEEWFLLKETRHQLLEGHLYIVYEPSRGIQEVAMFEDGEFIDIGGAPLFPTHWRNYLPDPIISANNDDRTAGHCMVEDDDISYG